MSDDGRIVGLSNPDPVFLSIENQINYNVQPLPDYALSQFEEEGKRLIGLNVHQGMQTPYYCRNKAYKRQNTSTVETDYVELIDLILKGRHQTFDELPFQKENLTFNGLADAIRKDAQVDIDSRDLPAILQLYTKSSGFNHAGELLSDQNGFPGIRIIRFGKDGNTIRLRESLENKPLTRMLEEAVDIFRQQYQPEKIGGMKRVLKALIPEESFREALANGLAHRNWAIDSPILIKMYAEHIMITAPGALPEGMLPEQRLQSAVTRFRNRILAAVFLRLDYIEGFGPEADRLTAPYKSSCRKPEFNFLSNTLVITLPVPQSSKPLFGKQNEIYRILELNGELSISEIEKKAFCSKKVIRNNLKS